MKMIPKKSLGQNFLVNQGIVEKIISAAELSKKDTVLEVGPGKGILTEELIRYAGCVIAVEKDKRLFELLKEKFFAAKNLELINEDIFKFNIKEGLRQARAIFPERTSFSISPERSHAESRGCLFNDYKLVANIPYNITGQFFHNFLLAKNRPQMIIVMVQKEVGERLLGKNKSILSLAAELYGRAEKICDVSPGSFSPPPKVTSSVIKLICGVREPQEKKILHLAKIGFASKRKKLISNLSTGLKIEKNKIKEVFDQTGLNENARAEELSKSDWLKLAKDIVY